ncbi:hypothetical protein K8R33_03295 [archaeon]|nr:hypothetical protein [archaeon]
MKDIFEANILCDKCNIKTDKKIAIKDGYKIRFFECPKCKEKIYHPLDLKEYQEFKNLKRRQFNVKLRMVGNSFSVTIPREIIDFEEKFAQMENEMNQMIRLSLEEPGRLSLRFRKILE